jgi:hypothetical protein
VVVNGPGLGMSELREQVIRERAYALWGAGRTARGSESGALVAGGDGDCSRTGSRRAR